ncbi:unnamed protein product [Ceutorhynchus assimilis]|uniref:Uncharacterized protein n=1 Tax=Ceutorhynchus assimilis TaxID=467358 RepID=A0A9N9QM43_9CUCU|nr:unnamed protein product [Ceutorhynchus assimilis]
METVFVLLGLLAVASCQMKLPPKDMRILLESNTQCQKLSGATQQEIMATIQGNFSDSPALKDHIFCLGEKLKLISSDGKFDRDFAKSKMMEVIPDEAKIDEILDKCLIHKDNARDSAYESIKCFSDNRDILMA